MALLCRRTKDLSNGTYDAQQHLHTALVQCAGADPGLGACPPQGNFEKFTPLIGNFKAFQVNNNNSINNNK